MYHDVPATLVLFDRLGIELLRKRSKATLDKPKLGAMSDFLQVELAQRIGLLEHVSNEPLRDMNRSRNPAICDIPKRISGNDIRGVASVRTEVENWPLTGLDLAFHSVGKPLGQ